MYFKILDTIYFSVSIYKPPVTLRLAITCDHFATILRPKNLVTGDLVTKAMVVDLFATKIGGRELAQLVRACGM